MINLFTLTNISIKNNKYVYMLYLTAKLSFGFYRVLTDVRPLTTVSLTNWRKRVEHNLNMQFVLHKP